MRWYIRRPRSPDQPQARALAHKKPAAGSTCSANLGGERARIAAEAEAAKGNALAGLVSQASGRNVFDRVEQGASNFKKKAAKAAADEAKAELAELAAGGANVPSADDAAGNMPLRPDADPEIKKLRKQLRHSVSRTNYDQIVAQLKDTKMRLVEALSKAKEAPAAARPRPAPSRVPPRRPAVPDSCPRRDAPPANGVPGSGPPRQPARSDS